MKFTYPPDFSGLDPDTGERWMPRKVARLLGLRAVNDPEEIREVCERVVAAHPEQAATYRKGKTKIIGFFIKYVMDETRNGADPTLTKAALEKLLGS